MDKAHGYVLWVLKLKSDDDRAGKFQLHRKGRTTGCVRWNCQTVSKLAGGPDVGSPSRGGSVSESVRRCSPRERPGVDTLRGAVSERWLRADGESTAAPVDMRTPAPAASPQSRTADPDWHRSSWRN
ncbi:hypothetical protein D4764_01G0002510 [Takifugu flavidus]|uniref:Uncharacterized protein n=1 Tax=Takifugu flavidus TaxID=433684 RepID=A0A5C6PNG8_9TELE|nr:hypothetical protein D4764_01G0002510 [Takifugu flavidus]